MRYAADVINNNEVTVGLSRLEAPDLPHTKNVMLVAKDMEVETCSF